MEVAKFRRHFRYHQTVVFAYFMNEIHNQPVLPSFIKTQLIPSLPSCCWQSHHHCHHALTRLGSLSFSWLPLLNFHTQTPSLCLNLKTTSAELPTATTLLSLYTHKQVVPNSTQNGLRFCSLIIILSS